MKAYGVIFAMTMLSMFVQVAKKNEEYDYKHVLDMLIILHQL